MRVALSRDQSAQLEHANRDAIGKSSCMEGNGNSAVSEIQREKEIMKMIWKFAMAGVLAILVSGRAIGQEGQSAPHDAVLYAPHNAVLYGFGNASDLSTLAEGPVKETCSHAAPAESSSATKATNPPTEDEEAKLADKVAKQLEKKLAKKMPVLVAPPDTPAAGSLVITGCFMGADSGNAAKRLVGLGLGASHLSAHVRVFYVGASGPVPVDEFDLAVKGSKKLPPLGAAGLAFNAVSEKNETLQADAKRLADGILKKLKKDQRNEPSPFVNLSSI
jgi:hypothetical protein